MSAHGHRGIALPDDGNRDARVYSWLAQRADVDASGRSETHEGWHQCIADEDGSEIPALRLAVSPPLRQHAGGLPRRHGTNLRMHRYEAIAAGVFVKRSSIRRTHESLIAHARVIHEDNQATISPIRRSSSG
jgi:hypothetical protein